MARGTLGSESALVLGLSRAPRRAKGRPGILLETTNGETFRRSGRLPALPGDGCPELFEKLRPGRPPLSSFLSVFPRLRYRFVRHEKKFDDAPAVRSRTR